MKVLIIIDDVVKDTFPTFSQGEKGEVIKFQLLDDAGYPFDLTTVTTPIIKFKLALINVFDELLFNDACTITDAANGKCEYTMIELWRAGTYNAYITLDSTEVNSVISLGFFNVTKTPGYLGSGTIISETGTTDNLPEGLINLYYTDARVSANADVTANTAKVTNATHTGDVSGDTILTIGVDKVNDTHIDFGTGVNQVSTVDIPEETNLYYTDARVTANTEVTNATTHIARTDNPHSTSIDNLSDTTITTPASGQGLIYDGADWVNEDLATQAELNTHLTDLANPHTVSLEQARTESNLLAGAIDMGNNTLQNFNYGVNSATTNGYTYDRGNRPFTTEADSTVTVGVGKDYTTIQEALDNIPFIIRHKHDITIDNGVYVENLFFPPFTIGRVHYDNPTWEGAIGVTVRGQNSIVDSIMVSGVTGALGLMLTDFTIATQEPYSDEGACVSVYGSNTVQLNNLTFSDATAKYGVLAYCSNVLIYGAVMSGQESVVYAKNISTAVIGDSNTGASADATGNCTVAVCKSEKGSYVTIEGESLTGISRRSSTDSVGIVLDSATQSMWSNGNRKYAESKASYHYSGYSLGPVTDSRTYVILLEKWKGSVDSFTDGEFTLRRDGSSVLISDVVKVNTHSSSTSNHTGTISVENLNPISTATYKLVTCTYGAENYVALEYDPGQTFRSHTKSIEFSGFHSTNNTEFLKVIQYYDYGTALDVPGHGLTSIVDFVPDSNNIRELSGETLLNVPNVDNYGLKISSSDSTPGGASNLLFLETTDVAWDRPLLRINDNSTDGGSANIRLDGPNPDIEFVENDQTSPDGKYELAVNGNRFQFNSRNGADNSFETVMHMQQLDMGGCLGIGVNPSPNSGNKIQINGGDITIDTDNTLNFSSKSATTPAIDINADGGSTDVDIWRVGSDVGNGTYGFWMKYNGTGNGIDNSLSLYTDNSTGTPVEAYEVKQNGELMFKQDIISVPNLPIITTGIIAPISTPTKIGDTYIDTTASKIFTSKGTVNSDDWVLTGGQTKTRYLGSVCTGISGATNRVLTHNYKIYESSVVWVNGRIFHPIDEYTVSGTDITFLLNISNSAVIHILN